MKSVEKKYAHECANAEDMRTIMVIRNWTAFHVFSMSRTWNKII